MTQKPMRRGVGLLLLHHADPRLLLTGRRIERNPNAPEQWQWPQGGRKKQETPKQTALREGREEVGVKARDMRFLGFLPRTTAYEYPEGMRPRPYRGQIHRWAVFRYKRVGLPDLEEATSMDFSRLDWQTAAWTLARTAAFRQPSYAEVVAMLAEFSAG